MPKKELQAFLTTKGFKDLQGLNADYFKCSLMLMKTTSIYKNKSSTPNFSKAGHFQKEKKIDKS